MLDKIKFWWNKLKLAILAILASLAVLFMIFKRKSTGDLGEYLSDEAKIKEDAQRKLDLEAEKLKKEKESQLLKEEQEKKDKIEQAERAAKLEAERLKKLEKTDNEAFKREMERILGVKEKKKG